MEEIIDELQELNEAVSLPLDLPSEDDLVLVQEQILIHLPFQLRTFLLEVSDVVYGSIEPVTVADPRSHTFLPEMASLAWSLGMPREYIPICEYNGGYACIAEDETIYFWQPGSGIRDEEWENIWYWCREVWLKS